MKIKFIFLLLPVLYALQVYPQVQKEYDENKKLKAEGLRTNETFA